MSRNAERHEKYVNRPYRSGTECIFLRNLVGCDTQIGLLLIGLLGVARGRMTLSDTKITVRVNRPYRSGMVVFVVVETVQL
jgi:hypothetical protein